MGEQVWTKEHPLGLVGNDEVTDTGIITQDMSVPYVIDMGSGTEVDVNFIAAKLKPGLPLLNSTHPNDPFLFVKRRGPYSNQGPQAFTCQVNYESIGNPLLIPAKISWRFASTVEPIDIDTFGNPIINSAGETPDPPITEDFHDLVLRIDQNLTSFDPLFAADMINSVNNGLFLGVFPPRTAKLITFSGDRKVVAPLAYVPTTIEIQFRLDLWDRSFSDKGFREFTGETRTISYADGSTKIIGDTQKITDSDGNEISEPKFLDGLGRQLADGEPVAFLTYRTKKERNFDLLGIVIP
jgi:hypothetical protein